MPAYEIELVVKIRGKSDAEQIAALDEIKRQILDGTLTGVGTEGDSTFSFATVATVT